MTRILYIIFQFISTFLIAQNCDEIEQNTTAYGHFNVRFTNKAFYKNLDSVKTIRHTNDLSIKLNDFKRKFPKIFNGKCLSIQTKNLSTTDFLFCDKSEERNSNYENPVLFGKFELISSIDEFYIFNYSSFEIGGYFIFNSKDNYFYHFNEKPIISYDKKHIYSINNHPIYGFTLNILEIEHYRELNYSVSGKIDLISQSLLKYPNENYVQKVVFDKLVEERDNNNKLINTIKCRKTLIID